MLAAVCVGTEAMAFQIFVRTLTGKGVTLEVESNETLTDQQVASLFAEKFFSDDYIDQVQNILRAECDYEA